ncbi:MAG: CAP domain-containing protein [bacterium]|nr:CAP domain-containing protein [bacterium]
MKLAHKLAHLIVPGESNNQKAKLLHHSGVSVLALFLILFQLVLTYIPRVGPSILGYAANISPGEVIRLTNEKRAQAGLLPLSENPILSQAAQAKGADMLNRDYWAHIAPDGTQPWKFFIDSGYKYRYAGENLARDFSNPSSAVDAWMASPTHKENLLSSKYKEIGIAVVEGDMAGVDTTVIVQFFGSKFVDTTPSVPLAGAQPGVVAEQQQSVSPALVSTPTTEAVLTVLPSSTPAPVVKSDVFISPFSTTKSLSLFVVGMLLAVLVIDGVLISKRRIARIGGRTFAHVAFLGMIIAITLILKAGQII